MSKRIVSSLALMLAASVLAPIGAQAVPATAIAKAEARYEAILSGGTFTARVPSTTYSTTVIEIGDVIGAAAAVPSMICDVPATFCLFGGTGTANAIANNGHIRVEAGVGPFSVDFAMSTPGLLIVNALVEDTSTLVGLGGPGGEGDALADIGDFTLTPLGGVPIEFGADPGDPASIPIPVGIYTLTWAGLDVAAEAKLLEDAVPAPATLPLLVAALAALWASRRPREA
ncbi:MAG: PEP-CTERM sorting domain-containing protein [Alphaproteobacteria bacterium]|nr:PEP-CTERM sorting domain-containing protein [Alphaproteobacteria bacterium]